MKQELYLLGYRWLAKDSSGQVYAYKDRPELIGGYYFAKENPEVELDDTIQVYIDIKGNIEELREITLESLGYQRKESPKDGIVSFATESKLISVCNETKSVTINSIFYSFDEIEAIYNFISKI